MALPILAVGQIDGIMDAIERENILYLKKFPKIGDKLARQMILDLKGKLGFVGVEINNSMMPQSLEISEKRIEENEIEEVTGLDEMKLEEETGPDFSRQKVYQSVVDMLSYSWKFAWYEEQKKYEELASYLRKKFWLQ